MKKLVLVILAIVVVSSSAFAEGAPTPGQLGLQTAVTFTNVPGFTGDLGAKYIITSNIAVRAALGLSSTSSGGALDDLLRPGRRCRVSFWRQGAASPRMPARR